MARRRLRIVQRRPARSEYCCSARPEFLGHIRTAGVLISLGCGVNIDILTPLKARSLLDTTVEALKASAHAQTTLITADLVS
jgi:hypothetical protein